MEIKRKKFNRTVPRVAMLGADNSNDQQSLIMTVRQMQSYIMELQRQLDALQRTVSAVESSLEPENLSALLDSVGGKQESVVPDTTVNIDDGGSDDVTWTYMDDRLRKSTAYSEDAEADGAPIRYAAFYEVALSSDLAALPTDIEPAFAYVSSDGSYYMIQDGDWISLVSAKWVEYTGP